MRPFLLRLTPDQEKFFDSTLVSKTAFVREAVDEKIRSWKNEMKKMF